MDPGALQRNAPAQSPRKPAAAAAAAGPDAQPRAWPPAPGPMYVPGDRLHQPMHPGGAMGAMPVAWPHDAAAHNPAAAAFLEQQAQTAMMQQFTSMVASAAAAGAMAAIQACYPNGAHPGHTQATFLAAANGAASFAATRAGELFPAACTRFAPVHPALVSAAPAGAGRMPPHGMDGAPAALNVAAHPASGAPASSQPEPAGAPPFAQAASLRASQDGDARQRTPRHEPPGAPRNGGADLKVNGTGNGVAPGQQYALHSAGPGAAAQAWHNAPTDTDAAPEADMLTPHEAALIKKVQIYAWMVRYVLRPLPLVIHSFVGGVGMCSLVVHLLCKSASGAGACEWSSFQCKRAALVSCALTV